MIKQVGKFNVENLGYVVQGKKNIFWEVLITKFPDEKSDNLPEIGHKHFYFDNRSYGGYGEIERFLSDVKNIKKLYRLPNASKVHVEIAEMTISLVR